MIHTPETTDPKYYLQIYRIRSDFHEHIATSSRYSEHNVTADHVDNTYITLKYAAFVARSAFAWYTIDGVFRVSCDKNSTNSKLTGHIGAL